MAIFSRSRRMSRPATPAACKSLQLTVTTATSTDHATIVCTVHVGSGRTSAVAINAATSTGGCHHKHHITTRGLRLPSRRFILSLIECFRVQGSPSPSPSVSPSLCRNVTHYLSLYISLPLTRSLHRSHPAIFTNQHVVLSRRQHPANFPANFRESKALRRCSSARL